MSFLEKIKKPFSKRESENSKEDKSNDLLNKINILLKDFKFNASPKDNFTEADSEIFERAKALKDEMDSTENINGSLAMKFSRLNLSNQEKIKIRSQVQDIISTLSRKKNPNLIANKDREIGDTVSKLKQEGKHVVFDGGDEVLNHPERFDSYIDMETGNKYFKTKDGKDIVNVNGEKISEKVNIEINKAA